MDALSYKILITKYKEQLLCITYENDRAYDISFIEKNALVGAIYIAKVKYILKNIEAAFLEIEVDGEKISLFYNLKENMHHIFADENAHTTLKEGDDIIVQVARAAIKTKLAGATSCLSFSGRYSVVSIGNGSVGISSKITDGIWKMAVQDELLKDIPKTTSIIVRTSAYGVDVEEIKKDISFLQSHLQDVLDKKNFRKSPTLLLPAKSTYIDDIYRHMGNGLVDIVTDVKEVYTDISKRLRGYGQEKLCRLYTDMQISIQKLYSIETLIQEALSKKVWLKSGGYLVIEHVEALTAIDVNTGKNLSSKTNEEIIFQTNIEAVVEVARQLRLRNISGMILIDVINMKSEKKKQEVLARLKKEVKRDYVKCMVFDITKLGLIEMTRQKKQRSLWEYCQAS